MRMAAMSAAPAGTTTLTPPSSSHGNPNSWNYSSTGHTEHSIQDKKSYLNNDHANRMPLLSQNGNSSINTYSPGINGPTKKTSTGENLSTPKVGSTMEMGYLSPPYGTDSTVKSGGNSPGAVLDPYSTSRNNGTSDAKRNASEVLSGDEDEASKWIHRDKLARIESEELQAAGIILPRPRAFSRPRGAKSAERLNGFKKAATADVADQPLTPRGRKDSTATDSLQDTTPFPSWDLRLPEEIAAAASESYWTSNEGPKGSSKIPVAKLSPVPIPVDYLERDSPTVRKMTDPSEPDSIAYPKPRKRSRSGSSSMKALESSTSNPPQLAKRSITDLSPKKGASSATRKTSAPAKAAGAPAGGKPKTRSANKDSTSSSGGTRPSTRSGELSPSNAGASSKQPEGDPPWMVSAYRPDPRLPPDQQLLPTVARRLQQEKWEKEGKFGNIYDKEFRPLTDDGFLKPPEPEAELSQEEELPQRLEWPLKEEKSPTLKQGRSYSTMPKISDKAPVSPLPSPGLSPVRLSQQNVPRVPEEAEEDTEKKKGCGCCIVM